MNEVNHEHILKPFKENGFCISRNFLSCNEIKYACHGYKGLLSEYQASRKLDTCRSLNWVKVSKEKINTLFSEELLSRLTRLGQTLLEADTNLITIGVRLFDKYSGAKSTAPHQDKAYEANKEGDRINIWIPLDRTCKNNGALYYLKGNQTKKLLPHIKDYESNVKTLRVKTNISQYKKVAAYTNPGDIIIHNNFIIHGSFANKTTTARRAIVIVIREHSMST